MVPASEGGRRQSIVMTPHTGQRILLEFGVVAQRFALLDSIPAVKSDVSGYFATSYGKWRFGTVSAITWKRICG